MQQYSRITRRVETKQVGPSTGSTLVYRNCAEHALILLGEYVELTDAEAEGNMSSKLLWRKR